MPWSLVLAAVVVIYILAGIRVVRHPDRGLVERWGRYRRLALPGLRWIIPGAERLFLVNVTQVRLSSDRKDVPTRNDTSVPRMGLTRADGLNLGHR